ncbi:dipeptidase [Streptomyces sp. NPDC004111]|uniref:dipeptidase n=1 Tax=Streptomyces sp. NPDC004111 TaxID=3364690 RepID=UPI0036833913
MALLQDDPQASPVAGQPARETPGTPRAEQQVTDPATAPAGTEPLSAAEPAPAAEPLLEQARALLAVHPVADGHNGLAWALRSVPWSDIELGESSLDTDIPRLRAGGVGAQFWSLHTTAARHTPAKDTAAGTGPAEGTAAAAEAGSGPCPVALTLEQIDRVLAMVRSHPEGLRLALNAGEVGDARSCRRIASLLGPAQAAALGDSLGTLRSLHTLGVRCVTLSGTAWARPTGLTRFGQEVVREMNRIGMLADLSGAGAETARDALGVTKAPVIFTRSGASALTDHPANVPDDILSALRDNGGLCMVPLAADRTGPSVAAVADHLDHVRALAGADCVGLSGTYDTGAGHPAGLADTACYPLLIAELLGRGWPEADLARLTWGNFQRVLRDAEFTARAAQQRRGPSTARIEEMDG